MAVPGPVKPPRNTILQIIQTAQPLLPQAVLPAAYTGLHRFVSYREELGTFTSGEPDDAVFIVNSVLPFAAEILVDYQPPSAVSVETGQTVTPPLTPDVLYEDAQFGEITVPRTEFTVDPNAGTITLSKTYAPVFTIESGSTGTFSKAIHELLTFGTPDGTDTNLPADGDTITITDGTITNIYEFDPASDGVGVQATLSVTIGDPTVGGVADDGDLWAMTDADGTSVTFEMDISGTNVPAPGNVEIDLSTAVDDITAADLIRTAIGVSALNMTTDAPGSATLVITQVTPGTAGNTAQLYTPVIAGTLIAPASSSFGSGEDRFNIDTSASVTMNDALTAFITAVTNFGTIPNITLHRTPGDNRVVIESGAGLTLTVTLSITGPAVITQADLRIFGDTQADFLQNNVSVGDPITINPALDVMNVVFIKNDIEVFAIDVLPTSLSPTEDSLTGIENYIIQKTLTGSFSGTVRATIVAERTDRATEVINISPGTFDTELGFGTANPTSPLSLMVAIGLPNTGRQVKAVQLMGGDTLAGHQDAIDILAGDDIAYGITPGTTIESALAAYKAHVLLASDPEKESERYLWRTARLVIQENKVEDLVNWETPVVALPNVTFNVDVGAAGDNDEFQDVVVGDEVINLTTGVATRVISISTFLTNTDPVTLTLAQPNAQVGNLVVNFTGVPVDNAIITVTDGVDTDIFEFLDSLGGGSQSVSGSILIDTNGMSSGTDAATGFIGAVGSATVTFSASAVAGAVTLTEFVDSRIVSVTDTADSSGVIGITGDAWNNWRVQSSALSRDEQATAIAQNTDDIGCRRVSNVWTDEVQIRFTDQTAGLNASDGEGLWGGGDLIWEDAPGYFLNAVFSAMRSGTSTGLPLAGRQGVGIYKLEKTQPYFTREQRDRILSTGTFLVRQPSAGGPVIAVRGVTSDDRNATTVEEMVTAAVDEFTKTLRLATAELFNGSRILDPDGNFLQDFSIAVQSVVNAFTNPVQRRARSITILRTFEDPNVADRVIMEIDYEHLSPANDGQTRIFVRSRTG